MVKKKASSSKKLNINSTSLDLTTKYQKPNPDEENGEEIQQTFRDAKKCKADFMENYGIKFFTLHST